MLRNKKGVYSIGKDMPKFIVYSIIILFVSIILFFGIRNYVEREVEIRDLQHNILVQRLFYDENCFTFIDNERAYPGIIDLNKFNENRLSNCISYQQGEGQGFILNLTDLNHNQLAYLDVNKELTLRMPECSIGTKFKCFFDRKYVLVNNEDKFEKALLSIGVITL